MPSYFLAETCKYAFLTADSTFWKVSAALTCWAVSMNLVMLLQLCRCPSQDKSVHCIQKLSLSYSCSTLMQPAQANNYIFTTEGHPIRIGHPALLEPAQAQISPEDGPAPTSSQDVRSTGSAPDAAGARSGDHVRQESGCSGMNLAQESEPPPVRSNADGNLALVRKHSKAQRDPNHPNPLLPSALNRRICPDYVQARMLASRDTQQRCPHLIMFVFGCRSNIHAIAS